MTVDQRPTVDLRLAVPAVAAWLSGLLLVAETSWAPSVAIVLWSASGTFVTIILVGALAAGRRGSPRWAAASPGPRHPLKIRRHPLAIISGSLAVSLALAALVATAVAVAAPTRAPPELARAAAAGSGTEFLLRVDSLPVPSQAGHGFGAESATVRFQGTLLRVGPEMSTASVASPTLAIPVLVFAELPASTESASVGTEVGAADGTVRIGALVELTGSLRTTDPGDSAAALVFGRSALVPSAPPPWWLDWANDLRAGFAAAATALPGEGGDLLPGLSIGDTSQVSPELDTAMKSSALSHLTAVSGANCAVVTALIMLLTGYAGLGRAWRIALSLVALAGFVVLVTPEPSVLRAAVMATIVLLSLGLGRPGRGVPALALVVIVLLVFDPWLSRNYGFALSVLATAGLLVLAGPLTSWLSNWMPAGLAALIALPFAAQLACQPVLLLLTPTMPLYGVPANLLAAPAAPVATIVGLIACVLLPWLPGVAAGLLWLAWLPAAWIVAVARTVADLPGSSLPWAAGPVGILLLIGLTVAGLALLLAAPPAAAPPAAGPGAAGPARRRSRGWRVLAAGLLVTAFGGYVGLQMGAGIGRSMAFPADWQLAACDIGQGDAVVVRDDDRYALIDVGPDAALLTECLDTLGIERIDLLVLTHYDLDHVGGVDAVVGRVGTVLAGPPENSQDEYLHDRLAANGATVHLAAQGDSGTLGRLDWKVLWPKRDSSIMQTGNDGSVTIEFDGRGIRSLFLGDLGEAAQKALQASSALGPVDVVKVAHHGSSDQDSAFYARLQATVGLVSVGADNGYGHPTKNALDALRAAGTTPLRTDRQGLLVVAPGAPSAAGAGALTIWTEKIADR